MDKVQVALEYVKKYHFWLLCGVAVVASLTGWMMARGTLSEEFEKGRSTVNSKFGTLEQIRNTQYPPNNTWTEEVSRLTDDERKKVASAWQAVFDEQQKVLQWPGVMGDRFKSAIMNWVTRNDPNAEIDNPMRVAYQNLVANMEFLKLPPIVDAKVEIAQTADDGRPPKKEDEADQRVYKVVWNADSQESVKKELEMADQGTPSTFAVWLKQENLWVYRALLNVISATNEGSGFTARVKRIQQLSIGIEAAKLFQKGMGPKHIDKLSGPGGDGGEGEAAPPPMVDEGGPGALDNGRYVGPDGTPLGGGVAQNEQFKRMPIYMKLVMDQRDIPRLLSECANSPLPVEVRQLRINPDGASVGGGQDKRGEEKKVADSELFDVTVEIHGIIYIFNPPDFNKLGQPSGGAYAAGM